MLTDWISTGMLLAVLITLITWYYNRRPKNFPPGPWGVPVLGYLPFLTPDTGRHFYNLTKKYGSLICLDFAGELQVVLNDFDVIKKTIIDQGDIFSGRPDNLKNVLSHKDKTMLFNTGVECREQRRFALSTLKDFGMGKSSIEAKVLDEVSHLLALMENKKGQPFDVLEMLSISVSNIICQVALGHRFDYSDPVFIGMLKYLHDLMDTNNTAGFMLAFPGLRNVPFFRRLLGFEKSETSMKFHLEFLKNIIEQHHKSYYPGKHDDYIDAYFAEKEVRQKTSNYAEFFDDEHLLYDLQILYVAGTDTTSHTMIWAFLYLMYHPDIQRKLHQEIDDVIGPHRLPSMSDRLNLPYMDAFMMEVTRKDTLVHFGFPRKTLQDVEVNGYKIPKNTTIQNNLWAVHNDPKLWGDPQSFRPERFINEKGRAVAPDYLAPFSYGKRQCPGEPLARMELFLYMTSILQKFSIQAPEEGVPPPGSGSFKTLWTPPPYKLRAFPRSQ